MEHIIHSSIMKHFDANNILSDTQHGFRYKRSCESQLIITVQEIVKRLAKGSQVDIILLDFAKAFDKVPHARLLHKLSYYGVNHNTVLEKPKPKCSAGRSKVNISSSLVRSTTGLSARPPPVLSLH